MVGRQALKELSGITCQLLALSVHSDQIAQIQIKVDAQRLQVPTATLTMPAGSQTMLPVDIATLGRQQRLKSRQHALGAL
jgi:hypothetical protein